MFAAISIAPRENGEVYAMKKLSWMMLAAALGVFSLGCEPQATTAPVVEESTDNVTSDTGEETPSAAAEEPMTEEKPADPAAEPPVEEKPADPAAEEKPAEEKPAEPADEPKPEEPASDPPSK